MALSDLDTLRVIRRLFPVESASCLASLYGKHKRQAQRWITDPAFDIPPEIKQDLARQHRALRTLGENAPANVLAKLTEEWLAAGLSPEVIDSHLRQAAEALYKDDVNDGDDES